MAIERILVVSGSRADYGLLEWPIKVLKEHGFELELCKPWGSSIDLAYITVSASLSNKRPDVMLILGDRYEILAAATAAHLQRIPIAHLCGGDVTEGSYDNAMRDAISRMASIHFVTSTSAMARLTHFGYTNVHLVGSPGIDYIKHAPWRNGRPYDAPYNVVSYQSETIDAGEWDTVNLEDICEYLHGKTVWILPNPDHGSEKIAAKIRSLAAPDDVITGGLAHDEFLNLIAHCEEFIGNSSAMLYEAPELSVKTRMIGKRQKGRVIPWGDGNASERIAKILRYTA